MFISGKTTQNNPVYVFTCVFRIRRRGPPRNGDDGGPSIAGGSFVDVCGGPVRSVR